MRKKVNFTMAVKESATDAFGRFLLTKRANGVKTKTIETYSQHFHAISKHLDVSQEIAGMTAEDLRNMVISMQESGLSPNSIKSYTITLKAFLSWCNAEGITSLNMAKYKGEETIKERLKGECVKEVKGLNGNFTLKDANDWQKGYYTKKNDVEKSRYQ